MGQRPDAVAVGLVHVGAVLDQQAHDLLVTRPAVGQQDRLQQGRPAQVVDVVDVHVGLGQEIPDDLDVPALGRRDERHPAVSVCDRRVGAGVVRQGQDVEQALGTGVQERSEALRVLGIDIGLGVDQDPRPRPARRATVASMRAGEPAASRASGSAPSASAARMATASPAADAARSRPSASEGGIAEA